MNSRDVIQIEAALHVEMMKVAEKVDPRAAKRITEWHRSQPGATWGLSEPSQKVKRQVEQEMRAKGYVQGGGGAKYPVRAPSAGSLAGRLKEILRGVAEKVRPPQKKASKTDSLTTASIRSPQIRPTKPSK